MAIQQLLFKLGAFKLYNKSSMPETYENKSIEPKIESHFRSYSTNSIHNNNKYQNLTVYNHINSEFSHIYEYEKHILLKDSEQLQSPFSFVVRQDPENWETIFFYQNSKHLFLVDPKFYLKHKKLHTAIITRHLEIYLSEYHPFFFEKRLKYSFIPFFHPFIDVFYRKLNEKQLKGLFDISTQKVSNQTYFSSYNPVRQEGEEGDQRVKYDVVSHALKVDFDEQSVYSTYNWEIFFHIPLAVGVHLSKNHRYKEAQDWFHYIFNPMQQENSQSLWNFYKFNIDQPTQKINELLRVFSSDELSFDKQILKEKLENSLLSLENNPFQPHAIARNRIIAYQLQVLMKYLDNLMAWGDSLFRQDTIETINEATQLYVLAANLLGPRPQKVPPIGKVAPSTFNRLQSKLDRASNAMVDMESQFPFNFSYSTARNAQGAAIGALNVGHALYFCIPQNDKLLQYWDMVADRLFKIRHCMNLEGVVRQLPLFEPPIDPGMLVKAAAAGIDISSIVSGLNQPMAPVRTPMILQRALEICSELKSLGNSLLSALEKQDAEALALRRQQHELQILQAAENARSLQWQETVSVTDALVMSREIALERYRHYQRLLGKPEEEINKISELVLERKDLENKDEFEKLYQELIKDYNAPASLEPFPGGGEANQSGGGGQGKLHLNRNENAELNEHMPAARDFRSAATATDIATKLLAKIPDATVNMHYWGLGAQMKVSGGEIFATMGEIASMILRTKADIESERGTSAARVGGYERRVEDWVLQNNLAAKELEHISRQIISSLIREQITKLEYQNHQKQIAQSEEIERFLRSKYTNRELYQWMQGETMRVYYDLYKFAYDIAKKAEQTMKHELMRPEIEERDFIRFNYWDAGRKGLLSGEALYLDLKRMEMAYHDHNRREYELTKHVSLRQLDPLALLYLKVTGSCEVKIPEWLFDMDCPGHYMRRIKTVSLSIPCITGPYTSVNCTLSLLKSTLRKSPVNDQYGRKQDEEDSRFLDYYGTIQSIVTSNAQNDSGMFETNLRDERFLPFEGAGAESSWRLELPADFRQFDYNTISDVILHVRYTARQGGGILQQGAISYLNELVKNNTQLALLLSLRHDFPVEWQRAKSDGSDLVVKVRQVHFPYLAQGKTIEIAQEDVEVYAIKAGGEAPEKVDGAVHTLINFQADQGGTVTVNHGGLQDVEEAFLVVKYKLT